MGKSECQLLTVYCRRGSNPRNESGRVNGVDSGSHRYGEGNENHVFIITNVRRGIWMVYITYYLRLGQVDACLAALFCRVLLWCGRRLVAGRGGKTECCVPPEKAPETADSTGSPGHRCEITEDGNQRSRDRYVPNMREMQNDGYTELLVIYR